MVVATEASLPKWGIQLAKMWKETEPAVLVLLSLTLQVILMLSGEQRKRTHNNVIVFVAWSAYMAADSVAIFALGVISNNLHDALIIGGSLSASIELASFWAPFLLLHLGGQDTITAYALQDNELWLRHLLYLIVETGLAIYICVWALKGSRLLILSSMMLVAGFIKYAERTMSLRFASYNQRRDQSYNQHVKFDGKNLENVPEDHQELLATKMFQETECMFADDPLQDDKKSFSKRIVQTKSSLVSKLITMELELMYENLYTKAKVIYSWWGLALRLISFLLILSTLISFSFSCLHHRHNYSTLQLYVTFLLFIVAILLEGYAAFVFLTSCRIISWLEENGYNKASRAMKSLRSLRSPSWSNSMGQYSLISRSLGQKPMRPFCEVMELVITSIVKKDEVPLYVYDCKVKDYVKEGIYQYLEQAGMYKLGNPQNFSILNSKGRVPWRRWKFQLGFQKHPFDDDPIDQVKFDDMEFGEMVILWHIVTEVCYYHDYDSLIGWKDKQPYPKVYLDWKISKYLSRYLMQLYVVSSDMLPPRGPLAEKNFYAAWGSIFNPHNTTGETSNPEGERNRQAAHDQQEKPRRRRQKERRRKARVQACAEFWVQMSGRNMSSPENPILHAAQGFVKALLNDVGHPGHALKRDPNWKLLKEIWIELLASVANYCKENQHAQHLSIGGELLTHVWVLIGHLSLTDPHRWW